MNKLKRSLAMLLVLSMLFSIVPFTAFASESTDPTGEATESVADVTEGENHQPGEMARFGGKHGKDKHSKDERPEDQKPVPTEAPVVETTEAAEVTEPVVETTVATEPVVETTVATEPVVETTVATEPVVETTVATEPVVETTEATEATTEATEEATEPTEETVEGGIAMFGLARNTATLNENKPANGTTSGQPFASNTGSSELFRIPAITTLSDGTLVAAADARWNDRYDKGNIDTLVSWSKDNGSTWNYSYANYIDDGGNTYNISAATFIDPAMAVDGNDTIYMLVDLFPGQASGDTMSIYAALAGTGMDSSGHLLVSDKNDNTLSDMNYYVGDFDSNNMATLYTSAGADSGYDVDAWFNVYDSTGAYLGNLFTYGDTGFYVYQTSYLYLTKSTDGGKNWSAPKLLNNQVKGSSEEFYGVGPASGIVTSTGRIMFTCYTFVNADGNTSVIYSDDGGETWTRSASMTEQTSEAALAEADGCIYMFNRYGYCYISYDNGAIWSKMSSNAGYASGCEVSAMTYSKLIDGQTAILVAGPTSGRTTGKIFVGLVNEDHSINWKYTYTVDGTNAFQYSALTELNDGSIGLLYENTSTAGITYKNIAITDIVGSDAEIEVEMDTFIDGDDNASSVEVNVASSAGVKHMHVESATVANLTDYVAYNIVLCTDEESACTDCTTCTNVYTGKATVSIPLGGKYDTATTLKAFVVEADGSIKNIFEIERDTDLDTVSFEAPHFSVVGVAPVTADDVVYTDEKNVTVTVGQTATVTDTTGNYANNILLQPDSSIVTMAVTGTAGAAETTVSGTAATELEAGATYIIRVTGTNYALTSNQGGTTWGDSDGSPLAFEEFSGAEADNMWTLEASGDGYKLKSAAGYLNLGKNAAWVDTTGETFTFTYSNSVWAIGDGSYNIDALGGLTSYYCAGGWPNSGTRFDLYKVTEAATASTTITFTGVAKGTASAVVGNTKYNITVEYQEKTLNLTTGSTRTVTPVVAVTESEISAFNAANGAYVTAALNDNGNVVFTGVAAGTVTSYVLGGTEYTINVTTTPVCVTHTDTPFVVGGNFVGAGEYLTKLTMSSVLSGYDIALKSGSYTDDSTITWSIADESIATVTVGANGTTAQVNAVSTGTTYLTVTIDGTSYTIPVVIIQTTTPGNTSWKYCSLHIYGIYNTTVYYSWNCSGNTDEFIEAIDGEAIWTVFDTSEGYCINFYGAPDERYALTYMTATNSASEYETLADKNDPTNCEFYNEGAGYSERTYCGFSGEQVANDIAAATSLGCDGAQGFSRAPDINSDVSCDLTFGSEKLPEMFKVLSKVSYINDNNERVYVDYTEGMTIDIGYTLHYTIYACVPRMQYTQSGSITYSDFTVTDELTGATWVVDSMNSEVVPDSFKWTDTDAGVTGETVEVTKYNDTTDFRNSLTDGNVQSFSLGTIVYEVDGKSYTYNASTSDVFAFNTNLTLSASNFLTVVEGGMITNTAKLGYGYSSAYSGGALASTSNAVIEVLVVVPEYVIDFGLPVEIDLTNDPLVDGDKITAATATYDYGNVTITGDRKLLYTPTKILQGPEFIALTFADGGEGDTNLDDNALIGYGVRIYPATTVYYEEGFLKYDSNWTAVGNALNTNQSSVKLGQAGDNNYGYDSVYSDDGNAASNGTYAKSKDTGATASFTFTGTGFELYANSLSGDNASGIVTVYSQGQKSKLYMIDTALTDGVSDATNQHTKADVHYSLPIISEKTLPYGTYTVQLKQTNGEKNIYIDGVRIINTINDTTVGENNIYYADEEDNPVFYQLRDYVLHAIGVEQVTNSEYGTPADMAGQVYDAVEEDTPAIILDENNTYGSGNAQDLLDNGPKNELYIYPGQTLIFKFTTNRVAQLGLKSPTGSAKFTITGTDLNLSSLSTTVDMFYKIVNQPVETATEHTVTIAVTEGVLSVTDLKICDDPNAALLPLTQSDIENVLNSIYDLGSGDSGETGTPDVPTEPVDPELPEEPETPEIPEEPVVTYADAALTVSLVDYTGNQLASAELTANGVEGEACVFTAQEILAAAKAQLPEQYAFVDETAIADVEVTYGETQTASVQIGKVATLNITFINLRGRKQGTATITDVQTADGYCRIAPSEIKALAPAGRRAIWFIPAMVPYGNTVSIAVPVI